MTHLIDADSLPTSNCESLMYVINNRFLNLNWFEKFTFDQISSLVEQIETNVRILCSTKSEKDEAFLKLFEITFEIIRKLLENLQILKSSNQPPFGIETICSSKVQNCNSLSPSSVKECSSGSDEKFENTASSLADSGTFSRMSRGSGRSSILNSEIHVWIDSADRSLEKLESQDISKVSKTDNDQDLYSKSSKLSNSTESLTVNLKNEIGPLGIHIVPFINSMEEEAGLLIQGIEPGGRIERDGRFKVNDRIVQINDLSLVDVDFTTAQDIFKKALTNFDITLKLIREKNSKVSKFSSYKKCFFSNHDSVSSQLNDKFFQSRGQDSPDLYKSSFLASSFSMATEKLSNNLLSLSKKHEKRYYIRLIKEEDGLGFSLTTKDNPSSDPFCIFVKNILPKGSASKDGRLRQGDKIIEVNGNKVSNKSHSEVVAILRAIPLKACVDFIISRQDNETSSGNLELPRQLPTQNDEDFFRQREVLTFRISLNETDLGVSLKAKTCTLEDQSTLNLGLFVKSVTDGSAAFKDGRLMPNDQLLSINDISLLGLSNNQAMESIRKAMLEFSRLETYPDVLTLTVARPVFVTEDVKLGKLERKDSITSVHSTGEEQIIFNFLNKMNESSLDFNQKQASSDLSICNQVLPESKPFNGFYSKSEKKSHGINLAKDQKDKENYDENGNEDQNEKGKNLELRKTSHSCCSVDKNLKDVSANSQLLSQDLLGFQRDGFGRQSMSEKRNAMLSAKELDIYFSNKKNQEDKKGRNLENEDKNSISENETKKFSDKYHSFTLRPNSSKIDSKLGLKKQSSLDSLITIIQNLKKKQSMNADLDPVAKPKSAKLKISKCKNESFRAAVDKSYNCPNNEPLERSVVHPMEYLIERPVFYLNERPVDCPINMEMDIERPNDIKSFAHQSQEKRLGKTNSFSTCSQGQMEKAKANNLIDSKKEEDSGFENKTKDLFKSKKLIKNLLKSKKDITSWIKKKSSLTKIAPKESESLKNEKTEPANVSLDSSSVFQMNSTLDSNIIEVQPSQNVSTGLQLIKSKEDEYQATREQEYNKSNSLYLNKQSFLNNSKSFDCSKVQEFQSKQSYPANIVHIRTNGYCNEKEAVESLSQNRFKILDNKNSHYINYKDLIQSSNLCQTLKPKKETSVNPYSIYSTLQSHKRHHSNFQSGSGFIHLSPPAIQELRSNDQLIHGYIKKPHYNGPKADFNQTLLNKSVMPYNNSEKNQQTNSTYASPKKCYLTTDSSRAPPQYLQYQQYQQYLPIYETSNYNSYYCNSTPSNQMMYNQSNYTLNSQ